MNELGARRFYSQYSPMRFRTLGKTGLDVSVIGLGTWQFGGEWGKDFSQAEVDAILDTAAECGINLIDTAECYGPDHLSERLAITCRGATGRAGSWRRNSAIASRVSWIATTIFPPPALKSN
jgi:aryl-alcohol dehydrogenase-like predicted oxidoreductase